MCICKYCAKSYVKNATKMQNNLAKCIMFTQRTQQATSDLYLRWTWLIRHLIDSDSAWSSWNQVFWLNGGTLFLSCVCNWITSDAHRQGVLGEISECSSPSIHPSNQTWHLSTHLLDAKFNRVQGKVKQIIEKADCTAIISDGWSKCSWARNN